MYLILLKVIGIVTAPNFVLADIHECQQLIQSPLEEFARLLWEIQPKGHNVSHIIEIMLLLRPLIHCWSMPYECKNREFKLKAAATSSHKNVPYTLGLRNRLYMSDVREKGERVDSNVNLGTIIDKNAAQELKTLVPGAVGPLKCKEYSFVKVDGKKWELVTVIVIRIENLEPDLGIVKRIFFCKKMSFLTPKY